MSSSTGFPSQVRRNSKFESFLKRVLPDSEFVKVRAYSPCVVKSSTENLSFRHAVLTDKTIYLTDHPPRTIYGVTNVADIVGMQLVEEQPPFLSGKDQEICQHVRLTCRSHRRHKNSWTRRRTASEQNVAGSGIESNDASCSSSSRKPIRQLLQKLNKPSRNRKDIGDGSFSPSSPSPISGDNHFFFSNPISRSVTPDFVLSRGETNDQNHWSPPVSPPATSDVCNLKGALADSLLRVPSLPFFPSPETWPSTITPRRNCKLKSQSALGSYSEERPLSEQSFRSKSTSCSEGTRWTVGKMKDEQSWMEETGDKKTEEVNLYVLDPNSALVQALLTVREHYLIVSTLEDENALIQDLPANKIERVKELFGELRSELMQSGDNLESLFHLLQELNVSVKRHSVIRQLLWKDLKLISFLVERLKRFLNSSFSKDEFDELQNREDELEMALLLLNVLCVSFRETETVYLRRFCLLANKSKLLKDLIAVAVTNPHIPIQYVNMTKRMLHSFHEFTCGGWMNLPESELICLVAKVTNKCVSLLFEIIFACHEISVNEKMDSEISVLCEIIENSRDSFLPRFVTQFLELAAEGNDEMEPQEVVVLYHFLYVLKILTNNSLILKDALTTDYNEEFRYYTSPELVAQRIGDYCPLKEVIVRVMGELITPLSLNLKTHKNWDRMHL